MTFLFPLGLIGLVGVPIIIIIYILKNKYNEQTVTSTYLWELSERFFKRRNPLSGLTGIISLILQILTVIVISLLIARPIFTIPDSAGEYCFVLDASGSMNMNDGKESRFERAKDEIAEVIKDAKLGSTFTLVTVGDETAVAYERISDKDLALDMLEELECADVEVDYSEAMAHAQRYFDKNPSFSVYFVTDMTVNEHKNVQIINVSSQNDKNYSIGDVSSTFLGGGLSVNASVTSYTTDETLEIALYLDGNDKAAKTERISVKAGEKTPVTLTCKTEEYDSFRIVIKNSDSLASDNEFVSYNLKNETSYSVLIVSETPFFLQAALDVLTDARVDTVEPDQYKGESDYGLYIFHSYTPESLPAAAVWLINSSENIDDSGFGARGVIELEEPSEIEKTASTSSVAGKLLTGVYGKDIYISEYVKYSGMYTRFTTLFSYDSNPLIFAGVNGLGNREVVIGFDLHKADFSLSADFVPLLGNLLEYSCPDILERSGYTCGEEVEINLTANIKNVKAIAPDGEELYIDTSTDIGVFELDRAGTYTVKLLASGVEKIYRVYSGAPLSESDPVQSEESFSLVGEQQYERTDGQFDPVIILFICLALIFIADWMVYCYEKYQLR